MRSNTGKIVLLLVLLLVACALMIRRANRGRPQAPPVQPPQLAAPKDWLVPEKLDLTDRQNPVVEARARRFRWHFRQIDNGSAKAPAANTLVIDADADVELRIRSDDFLYTFSLPELGVHSIAVPGRTFHARFQSTQPGRHELQTDPLCGYRPYHDDVMGRIVVR